MTLTINNFFTQYVTHPLHADLNQNERIVALVASVALAIFTVGLVHVTVYVISNCCQLNPRPEPVSPSSSESSNPVSEDDYKTVVKVGDDSRLQLTQGPNVAIAARQAMHGVIANCDPRKRALFEKGLMRLDADYQADSAISPFGFQHGVDWLTLGDKEDNYFLSRDRLPDYFTRDQIVASHEFKITYTNQFFDYLEEDVSTEDCSEYSNIQSSQRHYWVDFANSRLGGGWKDPGCFVQEEIMIAEMPEFAEFIALHDFNKESIVVRKDTSPKPLVLRGVRRVQAVDTNVAYGFKIKKLSVKELESAVSQLEPPQVVNVLAMAAPRVPKRNLKLQRDLFNLQDIFNTLVAGFTLLKKDVELRGKEERIMVHSGKLGCGVFNNDPTAVYLLHRLAAYYVGVNLKMHGYSESEVDLADEYWTTYSEKVSAKARLSQLVTVGDCVEIIWKMLTESS